MDNSTLEYLFGNALLMGVKCLDKISDKGAQHKRLSTFV